MGCVNGCSGGIDWGGSGEACEGEGEEGGDGVHFCCCLKGFLVVFCLKEIVDCIK